MSLNRSVPPQPLNKAASLQAPSPDYAGLVQFLIQPFLENPDSLKVDCEIANTARIWIRVAFASEDKGRVFGRGGRNIQAIRTVIAAVAATVGQSAYLDIYGSQAQEREAMSDFEENGDQVAPTKLREGQRSAESKPIAKPRIRSSLNNRE